MPVSFDARREIDAYTLGSWRKRCLLLSFRHIVPESSYRDLPPFFVPAVMRVSC